MVRYGNQVASGSGGTLPGQRPQYDAALVLAVFPDGGHGGGEVVNEIVADLAQELSTFDKV